jgi:surface protein
VLTLLIEPPSLLLSVPLLFLPHTSIEWVQDSTTATTAWGDIGDWDVSGVADFSWSFSQHRDVTGSQLTNGNPKAATFVGTAISKWTTTSATSLLGTFRGAGEMNSDLSGWNVAKVTTLLNTFNSASKFAGTGLASWDVTKVTNMVYTFTPATSITSCIKRQIADAWKSNSAFTTWNTAWAADACPPLTDAAFKQASWGT